MKVLRMLWTFLKTSELRGQDSNLRPRGYEPRELPGCSTPRRIPAVCRISTTNRQQMSNHPIITIIRSASTGPQARWPEPLTYPAPSDFLGQRRVCG